MRTSVVLAVVALLLLGYILIFDRGTLSSGELDQRKGSALPQLVRARVAKLEIQEKGVTTVLVREVGKDDDEGLWQVQAPYRAEADQDAVDTLLGELEWLDGRRKLGPVNAGDEKRFGFDKPRIRLWFTVGKVRVPVIVGNESARGDGIYVKVGDPPQAMIAGKDLLEGLRQEPGHFHTKTLHDSPILVSNTSSIELRDEQGTRGVAKRGDELWGMLPDPKRLASSEVVAQLVDGLDSLRATRFVTEARDVTRYGLSAPRFTVQVKKTRLAASAGANAGAGGGDKPLREAETFELRVGGACEGHAGESYVLVAGTKKVLCAADADLDKLRKGAEALREPRLLPFGEDDLELARIEQGGKVLALTSKDGAWSYELTSGGKRLAQGAAREGAVADWLKALAATRATALDAGPAALSGSGVIALSFGRVAGKPAYTARALAAPTELRVVRGDEPTAVAFAPAALDLLAVEVARFRPLDVLKLDEGSVRAITIQRGHASERLARTGPASFAIEAPVAGAADPVLVPELLRLVTSLHAERYVADAARAEHGLSTPFAVVDVATASGAQAAHETIVLGAETTSGRFAQRKGDPAVFVIAGQLADLVASPLADRGALATPIERLASAEVAHGDGRARIERQGESFVGRAPAGLSQSSARELAETLATLRAVRAAAYDPNDAAFGFAKPFATVALKTTEPSGSSAERTLVLGADTGDGSRYARRSDQPAVLVLSKESVERLLAAARAPR